MRKKWVVISVALCFLVWPAVTFARSTSAQPQVSEAVLRNLTDDERNRQLAEIARSLTNLERRMDRIEDRFEKLDHDLKELKRKL